jgi:pre-mRNA-processing factor 19
VICLGKTISQTSKDIGYACGAFHPDGLLVGVGTSSEGIVKIYDAKTHQIGAQFDGAHSGPVSAIDFSENGYYLATASESQSVVKVWDLRKLACIHEFQLGEDYQVASVRFDYSGQYLAVAGTDTR